MNGADYALARAEDNGRDVAQAAATLAVAYQLARLIEHLDQHATWTRQSLDIIARRLSQQ